ncbi:somatostatin receptor type 2 [Drosophila grimshawi]|uniref:GH17108 n=1 Tax=Drosophila grimshawi TaxID=7222 RepID=B4J0L5_DROGR|nr:somatostatin receptor type 2 [Drosophila grimshawi]EDV94260.1 GH22663 [Drosophila grimshawi]EDV97870.1 GH17108 [Drosophila grimshawi]
MKGYSKPNGAANRSCHKDHHVHGGYSILLFVLTSLTLTSLITPTEQLTATSSSTSTLPNDTTTTATISTTTATSSQTMPTGSKSSDVNFNSALANTDYDKHMSAGSSSSSSIHLPSTFNGTLDFGGAGGERVLNGSEDFVEMEGCSRDGNFGLKLISMILYALVCIVGLFGNTLVIYVVLRFSKMQTVTNIYILNLAIADECFLIGIPFLLYTMQVGNWPFGNYMCKAYLVSTSVTQFTSSIFLLIMSADRYIAVCHPISSPRYRTPFVSKLVSAVAWTTSVLLMLPVILFASTVESAPGHISCSIEWPEAQSDSVFILYSLVLGFATPLIFIMIFYCLVIRKLHTVGPKHKSKEKKRSHRKVTKLVLTVITVYIMCWLPHWISQVALINSTPGCNSRLQLAVFLACGCLSYSNSAMNPILYAFLSDNFKKSFMKACTCAARNDINAQLQLENSFFPKFGKGRQSERLIGVNANAANSKHNKKKALVTARNNNAPITTTATTTTTAGTDVVTSTQPIAPPPIPQTVTPANVALLVVSAETNNFKPPVLHTDL